MSQHPTDMYGAPNSPYPQSPSDDTFSLLDQHQLSTDDLFSPCDQTPLYAPFSKDCSGILDGLNPGSSFAPDAPYSNNTSTVSTPDFSGFTFSPGTHTSLPPSPYPHTPGPGTPHPYPIQAHGHAESCGPHVQHFYSPVPLRSATNGHYLRPPAQESSYRRIDQPFHRRSLSQNDADRIAAANPQFFRKLETTRAASTTPEGLKRYTVRSGKGARRGHDHRKTMDNCPTSVPSSAQISTRQEQTAGVVMTSFHEGGRDPTAPTSICISEGPAGTRVQLNGPELMYMSHSEQTKESSRVIEIGAMAVMAKMSGQQAGDVDACGAENDHDVLRMVDRMENQLRLQERCDKAKGLRGCEMIREALTDKGSVEGAEAEKEEQPRKTEGQDESGDGQDNVTASKDFLDMSCDMDISGADGGLYNLLKNDLKANGFGTDGE